MSDQDEIQFLASYLDLDPLRHRPLLINLYDAMAQSIQHNSYVPLALEKPLLSSPTEDQLARFSARLKLAVLSLKQMADRGWLVCGQLGEQEMYGIDDSAANAFQLKPLEGEFVAIADATESMEVDVVEGACVDWPLGLHKAKDFPCIAVVEGVDDFLAALHFSQRETAQTCLPVCMPGAGSIIGAEAIPHFSGKVVWMYPHADAVGLMAADKWQQQLKGVEREVKIFDLTRVNRLTNGKVMTLLDLATYPDAELFAMNPSLQHPLPRI